MAPTPNVTKASPSPQAAGKEAAPVPLVPFIRAAPEHEEIFLDTTVTQTTSAQQLAGGFIDVPSFGYMRGIVLTVEATGGTGTAAVYRADAPWSLFEEVTLQDVNGAPIIGPISGYALYLANVFGGYWGQAPITSPELWASYGAPATSGNFSFSVLIPCELGVRDGIGSLPNMNSAQAYTVRISVAPLTAVYSTNPTGIPSVRVRAALLAYFQPQDFSSGGAALAQQPPALGTTQFLTSTTVPIPGAGQQSILLPRRGNMVRNLILVWRDNTGARVNTYPDPLSLYKDGVILKQMSALRMRDTYAQVYARTTAFTVIAGVVTFPFHNDFNGLAGQELRDKWLPTLQSTRLEIQGVFPGAGSLQVITNDVAPDGNVYGG